MALVHFYRAMRLRKDTEIENGMFKCRNAILNVVGGDEGLETDLGTASCFWYENNYLIFYLIFPVEKVVSTNILLVNPAKPSLTPTVDKNKKKENNLKKIKQKRKRSAREKIYLGQFQEDLYFLEDFVEFQKVCQQQTKTKYTVRK